MTAGETIAPPKVADRRMLIDGEWVDSVSGKTFETINPATGDTICQVAEGDKADVELAVQAARRAFESKAWRSMGAAERGRLLYKLADSIEEHKEELAALKSAGKALMLPINDLRQRIAGLKNEQVAA